MLQRFYKQNSNREDYWTIAMLFYNRLKNRGWTREIIEPIFIEAHSKIIQQPRSYTKPSTTKKMIYHRNRSYYTGNMIQMVSTVKMYVNYQYALRRTTFEPYWRSRWWFSNWSNDCCIFKTTKSPRSTTKCKVTPNRRRRSIHILWELTTYPFELFLVQFQLHGRCW